jgi:hypothetical protein
MSVIDAPPEHKSLLETWSTNERMRHVPPVAWIEQKLDGDLRRRIGLLLGPGAGLSSDDPRRAAVDATLRSLCRALERTAEVARQGRSPANGHAPAELVARVHWALDQAVSCVKGLDADLVGRRFPVQTFERSKAEPLYAALLVVIVSMERLTPIVRQMEPRIDERLLEHLVTLQQPLDSRPMA